MNSRLRWQIDVSGKLHALTVLRRVKRFGSFPVGGSVDPRAVIIFISRKKIKRLNDKREHLVSSQMH